MTKAQFMRLLQFELDRHKTQRRAATRLGISESALSLILSGKQEPSAALLRFFGLQAVTTYLPCTISTPEVNSLTVDKKISERFNSDISKRQNTVSGL